MLIEKHVITTAAKCHGCDKLSKFFKGRDSDAILGELKARGWSQRDELSYGKRRRRGMGYVVNYYCKTCTKKGVTAEQVHKRKTEEAKREQSDKAKV